MPNITIKEILASDKISELVDKVNFNFDQLLLNGGGPIGPIGGEGEPGPIGPRGTLWFTAADIYTTPTSPTWSGIEEQVNDPNVPGYPQYAGDPNKYLPVGLGTFPENTYQLGYSNKQIRTGDLYLQESDDSLNSTPSYDGDIWQYDINSGTWIFTGVNIKGTAGSTGSSALTEWTREANGIDDLLYPKQELGQDIARVSIGSDPTQVFNESHPVAKLSVIGDGNELVAFLERSLHGGNTADAATITMTGSGNLLIQGSAIGAQRQIQLQSSGANIFLDNGAGQSYTLDTINFRHRFTGGPISVITPDTNSTHLFENASGNNIQIKLSTSVSHAIDSDLHLILQKIGGNKVGIGNIVATPGSLLTVAGNASIGDTYKTIAAPANGLIVQGQTGIGYSSFANELKLAVGGRLAVNNNDAAHNPLSVAIVADFKGGGSLPAGGVEINLRSDSDTIGSSRMLINFHSETYTRWGIIGKIQEYMNISSCSSTNGMLGIIFSTNHNLSGISPNTGSVKMFIDNDGNVSIGNGITVPSQKLDVNGRIRIRGGSPGANKILIDADGSGNATWESAATIISNSGQGVPVGTIVMWGGASNAIPTGWTLCDGSPITLSSALGAQLQAQGNPFGVVPFFNIPKVPDLRQRFVVGSGGVNPGVGGLPYNVGAVGGLASVTLTEDEMPAHTHTWSGTTANGGSHSHQIGSQSSQRSGLGTTGTDQVRSAGTGTQWTTSTHTGHTHTVTGTNTSTGGGDPHENRPPYFALCFIIKRD